MGNIQILANNLPETNIDPGWETILFLGGPGLLRWFPGRVCHSPILCCRPACPQKYPLAPIPNCSCSQFAPKNGAQENSGKFACGGSARKIPAYPSRLVKPARIPRIPEEIHGTTKKHTNRKLILGIYTSFWVSKHIQYHIFCSKLRFPKNIKEAVRQWKGDGFQRKTLTLAM